MSWFLNLVGTPAALKAALAKETNLSEHLRAALLEMCDDKPWNSETHLRIHGSGHAGGGSSISSLTVERLNVLAEAPAEAPAGETSAVAIARVEFNAAAALATAGRPLPEEASAVARAVYAAVTRTRRQPEPMTPPPAVQRPRET
jgi:hypothetical protein